MDIDEIRNADEYEEKEYPMIEGTSITVFNSMWPTGDIRIFYGHEQVKQMPKVGTDEREVKQWLDGFIEGYGVGTGVNP